jgi:hypothetical protein
MLSFVVSFPTPVVAVCSARHRSRVWHCDAAVPRAIFIGDMIVVAGTLSRSAGKSSMTAMWWIRSRRIVIQFTHRGKPRVCAASPLGSFGAGSANRAIELRDCGSTGTYPGWRSSESPRSSVRASPCLHRRHGRSHLLDREATPGRRGARRREDAQLSGPGGRAVSARQGRAEGARAVREDAQAAS